MSGQTLRAGQLRRLDATLSGDLKAIAELTSQIDAATATWGDHPPVIEVAGVALLMHHIYNAAENSLLHIAETIDESSFAGESWHRELLRAMGSELPSVRGPVLQPQTSRLLEEFRAFRHRVRHAYDYELDAHKVAALAARATEVRTRLEADFGAFQAQIRRCVDELLNQDGA